MRRKRRVFGVAPFQKGNGGRKRGSKNRTSLVAAAHLEREAAACMHHGEGEEDYSIVIEEIRRRIW
jgi:hypothetical protein